MLVESASAIYDTLQQGIPNIFPVSSPALRYTLWVGLYDGGGMRRVGQGSAVFPLQSLARAKAFGFRLSQMASMPFVSCKFFASQKTYETIVPARLHRQSPSLAILGLGVTAPSLAPGAVAFSQQSPLGAQPPTAFANPAGLYRPAR
jgi:hypothetical protein